MDRQVDLFSGPIYRISPYTTYCRAFNESLVESPNINIATDPRIYQEIFVDSGRRAIDIALMSIGLNVDDDVCIITSSGTSYVSSCVTSSIKKYCNWTRNYTNKTKCVFVIHEFGKICEFDRDDYPEDIIFIEDFAHSFFGIRNEDVWKGDYLIFSLSKFLPIQTGGILIKKRSVKNFIRFENDTLSKKVFYHYRNDLDKIFERKNLLKEYYCKLLDHIGCKSFFDYGRNECPGAYVFYVDRPTELLQAVKMNMQLVGVECSVFYGSAAFFLPCNQNMDYSDVEYIVKKFLFYLGDSN